MKRFILAATLVLAPQVSNAESDMDQFNDYLGVLTYQLGAAVHIEACGLAPAGFSRQAVAISSQRADDDAGQIWGADSDGTPQGAGVGAYLKAANALALTLGDPDNTAPTPEVCSNLGQSGVLPFIMKSFGGGS
jgi:hypothetical protein